MAATGVTSAWTPLRYRIFRALWIATLVSNLGTWMQNVAAAWLMTSLTSSPLIIATVQAASTAPVFLLGFAAGAMADFVDRRWLLLITQAWMCLAVCALTIAAFFNAVSATLLLALTFAVGLGAAMNGPAWQAIVSELVPKEELVSAVSLNSAGFNLARAAGPAIAGLILVRTGAGLIFLLNALSFLGVLWALYRWREPARLSVSPAERFIGAMRAGIRYFLHAPSLQRVLGRTILFGIPASALWGLLPLVAKDAPRSGPLTYGILLAGLGIGALIGTWCLPRFKHMISLENLITAGTAAFSVAMFGVAIWRQLPLLFAFMLVAGIGWLILLTTLNATTRMEAPSWIEARALALYLMAFQGSIAFGSLAWGALATKLGTNNALLVASAILMLTIAARIQYGLQSAESLDLRPAKSWPEPSLVFDLNPFSGPVLVIVEYRVNVDRIEAFIGKIEHLQKVRRRGGAFQWGLFIDTADPAKYIEEFMVESWAEHLRQHERMTLDDSEIQQSVISLLDEPPRVSHYVAAKIPSANHSKRMPSSHERLSTMTPIGGASKHQLRSPNNLSASRNQELRQDI
ncbi:MAG: MFS transporter [Candidatus Eremiobacteraeota bacterium]|nr:MFS transporter [Candidatus Eremiobacteraeota bacterium]